MHYYQFNIGDYIAGTAHLDELEDLAYRRLIDLYYMTELPLTDDIKKLSKAIRMRTHQERIADVLQEFFFESPEGWRHTRIDKEISAYHEKSEKAKAAADARWSKKRKSASDSNADASKSNADASTEQSERNAIHNTLTNNHNTLTNNQGLKDIGDKAAFEIFWTAGMRKTDKKQALPIFTKLAKDNGGAEAFANQLARDVRARIAAGQFGFDTLSPMRYLKNERFNDEVKQATQSPPTGETEEEFLLRVNRGVMPEGYGGNDFIDSTYEVLK